MGGAADVLLEIKSHILEKAESEFGEASEESVEKTLANFGSPRAVTEKCMEGTEIISPALKKYLLLYTGILFAFHAVLGIISLVFKRSMLVFPFLFIPEMSVAEFFFFLPMAFVY